VDKGFSLRTVAYVIKRKLSYWKQVVSLCFPSQRAALKGIYQELDHLIDPDVSDFRNTTTVRNWVNENSVHLIDDEHDSYAFDLAKVVVKVWQYFLTKDSKPHLSCGPRAYLLKQLLDHLGFATRIIDILEIVKGEPRSHTLLEYYDTSCNKWVMQDPDFNVSYVNTATGAPLGAAEALVCEKSLITGDASGYTVENRVNLDGTIEDYFWVVVVYRYCYEGGKADILFSDGCAEYGFVNGMAIESFRSYLLDKYSFS